MLMSLGLRWEGMCELRSVRDTGGQCTRRGEKIDAGRGEGHSEGSGDNKRNRRAR